jgi:hypothetical protein
MRSTSATFQAETVIRRESELFLIWSSTWLTWSMCEPLGAGQLRHW